jgi:hypothetical protein
MALQIFKKSHKSITYSIADVPEDGLAKVYWMVKNRLNDEDAAALVTKEVTSVLSADGQITDTGVDGTGAALIIIGVTDLDELRAGKRYKIALKAIGSDGSAIACDDYEKILKVRPAGVQSTT